MINSLVVFMVEKVVERIGGVFVAGFDKVAVNIAGGAGADDPASDHQALADRDGEDAEDGAGDRAAEEEVW